MELSGRQPGRPAGSEPDLRRPGVDAGLTSAPPPPPKSDDHIRGEGPLVIVYSDFECPFCALLHTRLEQVTATVVYRHFPVKSQHPRAWPAACAAEAATLQGQFWAMHDALYSDQARIEDPHLWQRAEQLGLDVAQFEADRRSEAVIARVKRDWKEGVRAGVATTPTAFVDGVAHPGRIPDELLSRW